MPVRGSTAWQHSRLGKKIINRDEGGDGTVTSSGTHYVICAWSDCTNDACTLYAVRTRTHADGYSGIDERYMIYSFCTERHKQYWLNDTRPGGGGRLPAGMRHVI